MLRGKRIGLIVWGVILGSGSIALFALDDEVATGIGLVNLFGALMMIIFGIVNVVSTTKYNNILLSQSPTDFIGKCPSCFNEIQCTIRDFRRHGRFPEGYLYCPVCRKPISKNAFRPYPASGSGYGSYQQDTYANSYDNGYNRY